MQLKLGFSTCPNDTFMFDALVHGRIDTGGISYEVVLADILHLNQMALAGELDMVKVSYNTYGRLRQHYQLLDAGSALGYKCGPLLIAKDPLTPEELVAQQLPVAIPGHNTTANLLLGFFAPQIRNKVEVIFHEVMPRVLAGEAAAGVIIHENRFTYRQLGLHCIQDLGEYWESQTGLPIPLGAIVAKKSLGPEVLQQLERQMRESVAYAFAHPQASGPFVSQYAQEMDPAVMQAHIELYVNDFSLSLGRTGRKAVEKLLQTGQQMGVF
ncbi:MAG: 1,4-dihydroxy-6-naphthoate synthase [Bacteroidetes bacterium]|nr:MAG: 1,4-dihydroxy-6-naphthoate synthase [Bacteroidota bacterium]